MATFIASPDPFCSAGVANVPLIGRISAKPSLMSAQLGKVTSSLARTLALYFNWYLRCPEDDFQDQNRI